MIDDDPTLLSAIPRILTSRGFDVVAHERADAALAYLDAEHTRVDAMLVDYQLGDGIDGFDVLTQARAIAPDVALVIMTGDLRASTAATALELGAFHFITKPISDFDAVALTLVRAAHFTRLQRRARTLERRVGLDDRFETLIGRAPAMRTLYTRIAKVAESNLSVLVHGESGTGKELVARAIHARSARATAPFVALNCGAIPEPLIDSELFGHTKGAFTGASDARPGVFVEADGGTLLLDEIGELPMRVQARLLRVLEEHEVRAVGASGTRAIDVRVIAATHADLEDRVQSREFRLDLLYRLKVVTIRLPPLRERAEDIPMLAAHLVDKHATRMGRPVPRLSKALLRSLIRQPWPGNVRQLENVLQSALALSPGPVLDVDALPTSVLPPRYDPTMERVSCGEPPPLREARDGDGAGHRVRPSRGPSEVEHATLPLRSYQEARRACLDRFERTYFEALLARAGGNLSEAARIAGMDRSNLRRALSKAGLRVTRCDPVN